MKTMNNQPWFIDKLDKLVDEFYDQFENELGETLFVFMTEQAGRNKRTICEASEEIVAALEGERSIDIVNEEAKHSYDYYFDQQSDLSQQIITRLIRRFADEY